MLARLSEDSDHEDYQSEEEPESEVKTDFTKCIGVEEDGSSCIRIRRNGNYCWYHDPENPQVCRKCHKKLKIKQGMEVNGITKDATGLFEDCECMTPPTKPEPELKEPETKTTEHVDPE